MGEKVVQEIFPEATILRPTILFGRQDRFLNKLGRMAASWPIFPTLFKDKLLQPLYV